MRLSLISLLASLTLAACTSQTAPGDRSPADSLRVLPRALSSTEQAGVSASNSFGLRLLRTAAATRSGNVLLSPLSVTYALGLTMNGADGETLEQMRQTLGWGTQSREAINGAYRDLASLLPTVDPAVTLTLANGIWVRQPLVPKPAFVSDAQTFFGAPVQALPTPRAMYDSVNAWGNRRTNGMIPKALDGPPPEELVMLLANATYFAGQWRNRFEVAQTRPLPFTLETGTSVTVPTMRRSGGFRATASPTERAIELSYGNSAWSMLLLVPTTQDVGAYAAGLDDSTLTRVLSRLTPTSSEELYLPRFTVSSSMDLARELKAMGMTRAFTDVAEFPRLLDLPTLLTFVQHAVKVAVDEEGTKAAAVTVVGVGVTSLPMPWRVDRPFVFLIRERLTGTIAFAGIVRDPR